MRCLLRFQATHYFNVSFEQFYSNLIGAILMLLNSFYLYWGVGG